MKKAVLVQSIQNAVNGRGYGLGEEAVLIHSSLRKEVRCTVSF